MGSVLHALSRLSSPWAYLLIGLLACAESAALAGLVIPGEAALLLGGFLASTGRVSLATVIAAAVAGAVAGDSAGYEIGRRIGPALRRSRAGQRVGEARWARAEAYPLARRAIRRRLPAGRQLADRAMTGWRAQTWPAGPRRRLAGRLAAAGRALEEHLRRLEREPDEARLAAALPAAGQQVSDWCAASASAREAARSAALAISAGHLAELTTQMELEVGSVQAGVDYLKSQPRLHG